MACLPPPSPPPGVLLSELHLGPRVRIRPLTRQTGEPNGQPTPPPELCFIKGGLPEGHWSRPVVSGGQAYRPALVSNKIEIMEPIMNTRLFKYAPRYFRFGHDDYETIKEGLNLEENEYKIEAKAGPSERKKGLRSLLKKFRSKKDFHRARRRINYDADRMSPTDTPQPRQSIESWCARVRYRPNPGEEQQLLTLIVIPGKNKDVQQMLKRDSIPYGEEEDHYTVGPDLLIYPHQKEDINSVDIFSNKASNIQDGDDDEADWETTSTDSSN